MIMFNGLRKRRMVINEPPFPGEETIELILLSEETMEVEM